jgi:hypothetical protein
MIAFECSLPISSKLDRSLGQVEAKTLHGQLRIRKVNYRSGLELI